MKILITPQDIVKRCLWDNYVYYILGNSKEAERILLENKEFEINEKDAYVIGLLKVMETENFIHKFNVNAADFISNKSLIEKVNGDSLILLKKKTFDLMVDKYLDKFPSYWSPNEPYKSNLKELTKYIDKFKEELNTLPIETIEIQNFKNEYYYVKDVKKILKFNY